jgi:hypothetical protein
MRGITLTMKQSGQTAKGELSLGARKYGRQIEPILRRFKKFVVWDRFSVWRDEEGGGVGVYGWIKRPKDSYQDFIALYFFKDGTVSYDTSSAKYSLAIFKMLNGGRGYGHSRCKRVEHYFDVPNAIRL